MAPVSPAKRVTRARAAAKKTDTVDDAPKRKTTVSKVAKSTANQKAKSTTMSEEAPIEKTEQPKKASTRTTKAASLASAPRRRIRVTPLDAPPAVEEPAPEPPKESTTTKKTTTKTKQIKSGNEKATKEEPESQPKARTRTTKVTEKKPSETEQLVPKTRGRPKRATAGQKEDKSEEPTIEPAPATRQTRGRAASNAEPAEETLTAAPKTKTGKKVTFQDLPEDDKENHSVPTRKAAVKKDTTPATGMRAKPIRKPAAPETKKSTTTSKGKVAKAGPRPLTPKKVAQINRQSTPESSDAEDELSGSKTPVRDLSLSPKRNPQLGARLSPVKKLEFGQQRRSPDRMADHATLFSPARRPASPSKETLAPSPLKEAPRRVEVPPVFPSTDQQTMNVTATFAPSFMSQSVLLQSPKRVHLDINAFSQSATKPKSSPLKQSLLQSPARRLFSPAKRKTPQGPDRDLTAATPEEVAVSSHFRASVSPQRSARVHRMSEDELAAEMKGAIDFDQSVLSVRSPLKVTKSIEPRTEPEDEDVPMMGHELAPAASEVEDQHSVTEMTDVQPPIADKASIGQQMQPGLVEGSSENSHVQETLKPEQDAEKDSAIIIPTKRPTVRGTRLSEVLFRYGRSREEDESSEDELAAEMTPDRTLGLFRSSLTGAGKNSRLTTVAPSSLSRNVGFTPLAAQMSGWIAASPEKKSTTNRQPRGIFSPVAAQHIDGEVQISRQSTPRQHRSPFAASQMSSAQSVRSRMSSAPSIGPSPEKTSFFEEQMIAQDADEQMEDAELVELAVNSNITEGLRDDSILFDEARQTGAANESHDDTIVLEEANGELTTDLINFTNASDTAVVDFTKLAEEADQLAPSEGEIQQSSSENSIYGDENAAPEDNEPASTTEVPMVEQVEEHTGDDDVDSYDYHLLVDDSATPQIVEQEFELEQQVASIGGSPVAPQPAVVEMVTPIRPDLSLPRYVNTVVSKVPLRPEGDVSPIRVPKKRSRSLSTAGHNESPPKRAQLTPIGKLVPRSKSENMMSPDRRVRTAAPSPAHTTPGQMSFAVEDFGDSTLDGIELPEDEMDFDVGPPTATANPASVKSAKSMNRADPTPSRTPLKSVGSGILHGAVVYVEVHTTEGADASGVYVDLLTQMGARCVKDWRWNSRASFDGPEDSANASKIGITHVVYKDGGKRTLEKVRDAKEEVWCVGVRWVLDCERENRWIDETPYVVDHAVVPRGGSRRRKSMEPRALLNENGNLSKARAGRRVTSAEFMTEKMREELINTPVRTYEVPSEAAAPRESIGSLFEENTEISSTYNSPTTTMNVRDVGVSTPTELLNWDPATAMTPAPKGAGMMETPYLMKQGEQAMGLKSAPPKQSNKGIFDADDNKKKGEEKMKVKLDNARRRTMGWKPRVGSPLGKF